MLTIATTHRPATDLGFLLHKHPDKIQSFKIAYGQAVVFYPEASDERCVAALMLEIDPVSLTGRNRNAKPQAIQEYVNDRPYSANSHLCAAIAEVFRTALSGKCEQRPDLVAAPLPLEIRIEAVPAKRARHIVPRLFEPLGYDVTVDTLPQDPDFPHWGDSRHHNIALVSDRNTLQAALQHIYALLPVLDNQKHYWIDRREVDKLARVAGDWLPDHPERELITRRYLGYREQLTRQADAALDALATPPADADADAEDEGAGDPGPAAADDGNEPATAPRGAADRAEAELEKPLYLSRQRIDAVMAQVRQSGAASVLDLGCGEGGLLRELVQETALKRIVGLEVSPVALAQAARRLRLDRMTPAERARVSLRHGSLAYRDERLQGYDAAIAMEVIEHIDPDRLPAFAEAVFGCARPGAVIVTTPNVEYNARFPDHRPGRFRHRDHRFEWTRAEFGDWCDQIAARYGYAADRRGVGEPDAEFGAPTQMAVFSRRFAPAPSDPERAT